LNKEGRKSPPGGKPKTIGHTHGKDGRFACQRKEGESKKKKSGDWGRRKGSPCIQSARVKSRTRVLQGK